MAWENFLRGFWNGITAWVVLIAHVFGGWKQYPLYDTKRSGGWYDFGFLVGAGISLLGSPNRGRGKGLARPKGKGSNREIAQPDSRVNQPVPSV
ncbi:MAG: hypothetical protein J0I20_05795 [Chloroflexi bacterium]|nr:hypothetical protein [Chloroflexota bacterium]OJV90114.1 MAG: hypothetical protein BGO39_01725 [Chloroflexi bacterium 54-19]